MKKHWKSLLHKQQDKALLKSTRNEFPESEKGASVLDNVEVSRRSFLKTMGASMALAGISACSPIRKTQEKIYPYAKSPEELVPGNASYYATSYNLNEETVGLLGKSLEGRPIKIEGNPLYPANLGKTNSFHQASLLSLYDPDRLAAIMDNNQNKKNRLFVKRWIKDAFSLQGENTGILFNQVSSLTSLRLLEEIKEKFPLVKLYEYAPANNNQVYQGIKAITNQEAFPLVDFSKVKTVVSLDSDFLGLENHSLRYNRDFMGKRNEVNSKNFNRLYQFESTFSVTGGVADNRFVLKRNDIALMAYAILDELAKRNDINRINQNLVSELRKKITGAASVLKNLPAFKNIAKISSDLFAQSRKSGAVVVAGSHLPAFVHSVVFYINEILNAPISYYAPNPLKAKLFGGAGSYSIEKLRDDSKNGILKNLLVIGGDPAYNAYGDIDFSQTYKKLNTLHLSESNNLTASLSKVAVPKKHYLEAWSDNTANQGQIAIAQPLITPLFKDSFSEIEILNMALGKGSKALDEVKKTAELLGIGWRKLVHDGFVAVNSLNTKTRLSLVELNGFIAKAKRNNEFYKANSKIELTFSLDYSVYDGRFINNAWLQELPDPISKLTWDNAVFISHKNAEALKLKNYDLVELALNGKSVRGAVWVLPGQAEDSINLKLGYGQKVAGKIAEGSGFDAYPLFLSPADFPSPSGEVSIKKLDEKYILASVQDHWTIEDKYFEGGPSSNSQNDRPLVREGTLDEYGDNPRFPRDEVKVPAMKQEHERVIANKNKKEAMFAENMSVFSERKYDEGYQWGMTIDLSTCTGCNACVIACQAENNIPVVGKEMVLKGREMHWIRLDRYFEGDVDNPRMVHQPVNCMQCEQAPCEQVCPVNATVHSKEGLNDMVYNRCIGTRFCSNNCPFKVRRFNFFDYHQKSPHSQKKVSNHLFELFKEPKESLQLQFNPDVTVRMRGVMEKCTYCVQRINKARVASRNEDRFIKDGEIKTACEQVCPTSSIVFGDTNDPSTEVSRLKKKDRNYHLLAELNIKPRTTYLAAINNPNKEVKDS